MPKRQYDTPGVYFQEIDLTGTAESIYSGSNGLILGYSSRGPVNTPIFLGQERDVIDTFGEPTNEAERYFIDSCRAFLRDSSGLLAIRLPYGSGSDDIYSAMGFGFAVASGAVALNSATSATLTLAEYGKFAGGDMTGLSVPASGALFVSPRINTNVDGDGDIYMAIMDAHTASDLTSGNSVWLTNAYPYTNGGSMVNIQLSGDNGLSKTLWNSLEYQMDDDVFALFIMQNVANNRYEQGAGTMLPIDRYMVSFNPNKVDGDGNSLFIETVLAGNSYVQCHITDELRSMQRTFQDLLLQQASGAPVATGGLIFNLSFQKSESGNIFANTLQKLTDALETVKNPDLYDVNIVMDAGLSNIAGGSNTVQYYGKTFADDKINTMVQNASGFDYDAFKTIHARFDTFTRSERRDCVFIADIPRVIVLSGNSKVQTVQTQSGGGVAWFSQFLSDLQNYITNNLTSSYACVYANWVKVSDYTGSTSYWSPISSYAGAVFARTDFNVGEWQAPAGKVYGQITFALDVAVVLDKAQQSQVYRLGCNPVVLIPNSGYFINGQKTRLNRKTQFDRLNVRRLFLLVERVCNRLADNYVFTNNTMFTRNRAQIEMTSVLAPIKAQDGINDYKVVCDLTNNTPQNMENHEMVIDIYIKPVSANEYIHINYIGVRQDAVL